jgi:Xaa-Pro aminopeptidase
MREALRPGLTENELWSVLHQTNIAHGGEWIETRLLSSGPRTNPWMQECGHRTIEPGDLVAFDTDMIGPHGYCAEISRTYLCGPNEPTPEQRRLYRMSFEQLAHNRGLLRPGRTLRDVVEDEWAIPEEFSPYRYGLAHGVGLKDEYPFVPNREDIDRLSDPDQEIEPGMVFSVESYIGTVGGSEGVKLEDQLLITDDGPELLSRFPFEAALLG